MYASQEYEQKITPSSHTSTLRRNEATVINKSTLPHQKPNQSQPIYDSITTKPSLASLNPQNVASIGPSPTATVEHKLKNNLAHGPWSGAGPTHANTMLTSSGTLNRSKPGGDQYATFERNTLDYRLMNSNIGHDTQPNYHTAAHPIPQNHIEYRQRNGTKHNDEYRLSAGSDLMANQVDFNSLSNSSIANQLAAQSQTATMPRVNSTTISSKDTNRNHSSRNHIITDTLPGPESCV